MTTPGVLSKSNRSPTQYYNPVDHPLISLLKHYYDNWSTDDDANTLLFQKQYGLSMDIPSNWPYIDGVTILTKCALDDLLNFEANKAVRDSSTMIRHRWDATSVVIIYPSCKIYSTIYERLGDQSSVKYISWHEIYVAMNTARDDNRELSRVRSMLSESQLTIFVGAPNGLPELADQVRKMCPGRLIIIRTYEEKE